MSSNIIAFTQRVEFKTLLDLECKALTGFSPVIKNISDDFVSFLGLLPEIDVLIIDSPKNEAEFYSIIDAVKEKESSIKNLLILSDLQSITKTAKLFPLGKVETLFDFLKTLLNGAVPEVQDYISVPTDSLLHFKMLPFDLYIKISEGKYLKRIPANEDIEGNTIEAFKAKGVLELFFERKFNRDFSVLLLNNMINKVEKDYSSVNEKLKAQNEVFLTTKEIVQSVGLPPRVIEVCESMMDSISADVLSGKDRFSTYLSQLKNQADLSFQFRFVELTSFIATHLIELQNESDKEDQIKKVVFASFFCDVALTDASQLDYRSEESMKDLWPEDKKVIQDHALKASSLISKYKNAPHEADVIILQHHGSPVGNGFGKIAESILPLSKCLLTAQELAYGMLKNGDKDPSEVVKNIVKKFEGTPIHKYLVLFESNSGQKL